MSGSASTISAGTRLPEDGIAGRRLVLELPYPPSVNHYWRRVGRKTLISKAGRAYRRTVTTLLRINNVPRLDGRLAVKITIRPPDTRRRDLDNVNKALLDALEAGGVYEDDGQIDRLLVVRDEIDAPEGSVIVEVEEIDTGGGECQS